MDVIQSKVGELVRRLTEALNSHPLEELVLSHGTVFGSRYYTVEPIGGDWRVMEKWARKTYGEVGSIWEKGEPAGNTPAPSARWYMNNRKFWFRNEADRTLFLLKWQ
jgi:hypothetical protein